LLSEGCRESTGRAGADPSDELVDLGGEERSGEHRLLCVVMHTSGVRTLSRSKTLKLRTHGLSEVAFDGLSKNSVMSYRTLCLAGVVRPLFRGANVVRHKGSTE